MLDRALRYRRLRRVIAEKMTASRSSWTSPAQTPVFKRSRRRLHLALARGSNSVLINGDAGLFDFALGRPIQSPASSLLAWNGQPLSWCAQPPRVRKVSTTPANTFWRGPRAVACIRNLVLGTGFAVVATDVYSSNGPGNRLCARCDGSPSEGLRRPRRSRAGESSRPAIPRSGRATSHVP